MAIYSHIKVDLPTSKIFFKKQNNSTYVYYYTSFFRDENGKPKNTSALIGKLDDESGKLMPNDKYFTFFDEEKKVEDLSLYQIGYTALVDSAIKQLELDSILSNAFGNNIASDLLLAASYSIRYGSVMSYIDNFLERNYIFKGCSNLTSQRISELFASININDKYHFFREWISKNTSDDYIAYDVSSISTYSNGIIEAEYGYNRDHDDLRQINLGMFTATKNKMPVYYENYNGSITDKINLEYVLNNAKNVGIENAKLVMDGGFFDDKRVRELANSSHTFAVGMPSYLELSKDILDTYLSEVHAFKNKTSSTSNYAIIREKEVCGVQGRVLVGLCTETKEMMVESLKNKLSKLEEDLKKKKIKKYETIKNKQKYTKYFDIYKTSDGYDYQLKEEEIENEAKYFGYYLVFTNDDKISADDLLYYYREKDVDEKVFYQLKNYMGARRIRTHNQDTTDGKMFTLFIGLVIRSWIYQKIEEYKKAHYMTLEACFNKLDNIQVIQTNGETRLVKALTKEQKDLLQQFEIDIEKYIGEIK